MLASKNIQIQIDDFLASVYVPSHSPSTVKAYKLAIKHFSKFVETKHEKSLEQILKLIEKETFDQYDLLREFSVYLDKKLRPNSVKSNLTGIRSFLRFCGVKIYSEEFRSKVRLPKAIQTREDPLTREIILRVLNTVSPKIRVIILIAIASGMRIGEIIQLQLSDIDFDSTPVKIRIRGETTKTRESRETFLTAETVKSLKDYLIKFHDWKYGDSGTNLEGVWLFGPTNAGSHSKNDVRIIGANLAKQMSNHLSKVPELSKINGNGVHMIHFHAFRKYFYTEVSNISTQNFAHALMGHHDYLDTYYNQTEEKKRELYLKAEPHLTISDFSAIEKEIKNVNQRQKEIIKKQLELDRLLEDNHIKVPQVLQKYVN
ncbi:MAG: site-specific integrase [Thaumarchaeota archaeon]|nr:site-specific integrase [Nitrososphaerota archaeon]